MSKGSITTLLWLVCFYIVYFLMIGWMLPQLFAIEPFKSINENIQQNNPDAKFLMDLILYIVVPIVALIYTIHSMKTEQYRAYYYSPQ